MDPSAGVRRGLGAEQMSIASTLSWRPPGELGRPVQYKVDHRFSSTGCLPEAERAVETVGP